MFSAPASRPGIAASARAASAGVSTDAAYSAIHDVRGSHARSLRRTQAALSASRCAAVIFPVAA